MSTNSKLKRRQREIRVRKEKHLIAAREAYPKFTFVHESMVPEVYAKAVREAVKRIDLSSIVFQCRNEMVHQFLKVLAKYGYTAAQIGFVSPHGPAAYAGMDAYDLTDLLAKMPTGQLEEVNRDRFSLCEAVSGLLSELNYRIFRQDKARFIGWHPELSFQLCVVGREIAVVFRKFDIHTDARGKFWTYMTKPKLKLGPREYEVCFREHAIRRISKRFRLAQDNDHGAFALMHELLHWSKFRPVLVHGERYLQFYFPLTGAMNRVGPGIRAFDKTRQTIDGGTVDFRYSYTYIKAFLAPFIIEDGRIHILTVLLPGQHPTPESVLMANPPEHLAEEGAKVRHDFCGDMAITSPEYQDGLVFFHKAGIRQLFLEPADNLDPLRQMMRHYPSLRQMPGYVHTPGESK